MTREATGGRYRYPDTGERKTRPERKYIRCERDGELTPAHLIDDTGLCPLCQHAVPLFEWPASATDESTEGAASSHDNREEHEGEAPLHPGRAIPGTASNHNTSRRQYAREPARCHHRSD